MVERRGREVPMVTERTTGREAARIIVENGIDGLVVADADGKPHSVLSAVDVLHLFVPNFIVDDPALARVYDNDAAQEVLDAVGDKTVGELMSDHDSPAHPISFVKRDDSPLEVAATLIHAKAAVAAVEGTDPVRFVSLSDLIAELLPHDAGDGED